MVRANTKEFEMRVETYGNEQIVKKDEAPPERTACPVCHGMGVRERANGETYDCPNRSCESGFVVKRGNK